MPMLGNVSLNNKTNHSIGFLRDGCFESFTVVGCTRDGVEAFIALITVICCVGKVIKLLVGKHELSNQYIVFTVAIVEVCLLIINWMYLHLAVIDLITELLKLVQFFVIYRFYCQIASRMPKTENLYRRVFLPCLLTAICYFLILITIGIVSVTKHKYDCIEPEWLLLSSSEVVLGLLFLFLAAYINKQTNSLKSADSTYKRNFKRSLWVIGFSFFMSCAVSMIYDISMLFVGKDSNCMGLFVKSPALFTSIDLFLKVFKWLLPIWAMVIVFKPDSFKAVERRASKELDSDQIQYPVLHHSTDDIFKSSFRPRGKSFNYKHLREPKTEEERQILNANPPNGTPYVTKKKKKKKDRLRRGSRNVSEGSNSTVGENSNCSISPLNSTNIN